MKSRVVGAKSQEAQPLKNEDGSSIRDAVATASTSAAVGKRSVIIAACSPEDLKDENGDLRDEIFRLKEENNALRGKVAEMEKLFGEYFEDKKKKDPTNANKNMGGSGGGARKKKVSSIFEPDSDNFRKVQHYMRRIRDSIIFKPCQAFALTFALFGGAFWTICNIPDSPGLVILDIIMVAITLFFILETTVFVVCESQYRFSFYFWMDILGTMSMAFEISFLLGAIGSVHTVVLRAARTAKLGARVGRLLKVLKFLLRQPDLEEVSKAKVLSQNLLWALSTRVAVLTIALVMVIPLFSFPLFPTQDLSMKLWTQRLEEMYNWDIQPHAASMFDASVQQLVDFYNEYNYHPYKIEGFNYVTVGGSQIGIEGQGASLGKTEPKRKASKSEYEVSYCRYDRSDCNGANRAIVHFDMTGPNQIDALMGVVLIIFVVGLMIVMTFELNRVLEDLLLQPLERMLNTVRVYASNLCLKFAEANDNGEVDDDDIGQQVSELEMLEAVLQKLARIASLHMKKNEVSAIELENMNESEKAILVDLMHATVNATMRMGPAMSVKPPKKAKTHKIAIHTWELDVLQLDQSSLQELVTHLFFASESGHAEEFVDAAIFERFHEVVEKGYKDLPYHCYKHAIDILHDVFRIINLTMGKRWLSALDQYSLMIAALCHDIGHFGKTNAFLVETKHELALRYNDKAPLENMHASTLFHICNLPETDIFKKAKADDRKTARKICVGAILHTDNANHFEMVQAVSHLYEMCENICEEQAEQLGEEDKLTSEYTADVLIKNKMTWLFLFLHFSDIANSLKPWKICESWASRVLEEFFAQGDEEKKLGIPVGMLNDREKVNRPGSQHGFITFLVAPLVKITVQIFPMLQELHQQMAENLEQWRNNWVKDASPPADEIEKKDADVKRIKELSQSLWKRVNQPPMRVGNAAHV